MTHPLEGLLSDTDLDPYLSWTNGNRRLACEYLELNSLAGQALQPSIRGLELALAGRIRVALSDAYGEFWLEDDGILLMPDQQRQVVETSRWLVSRQEEPTPGRMAVALPYEFWASFLSPEHQPLWNTVLHRIVQAGDVSRVDLGDLAQPLERIGALREGILRPGATIIHWDLKEIHADIVLLTRSLSPDMADLYEALSRFPTADLDKRLERARRYAGLQAR